MLAFKHGIFSKNDQVFQRGELGGGGGGGLYTGQCFSVLALGRRKKVNTYFLVTFYFAYFYCASLPV